MSGINPRRAKLAPYVVRGQRIRAKTFNELSAAINGIEPPQDLDGGNVAGIAEYWIQVTAEETVPVRVENPDDPNQYVDLDRTITFTVDAGRGLVDALQAGIPITLGTFKS